MFTLLLRLQGPMQAWGVQSRFLYRETLREPTKSGVIGLVAAALGRKRHESIADLAALRMGVRVDREGVVHRDYHTAGKDGYLRADGNLETRDLIQSWRYYLADACFLVGLEGEVRAWLEQIHQALARPKWPLFLGRKAFPPSRPVYLPDGLQEGSLEQVLAQYPPLIKPPEKAKHVRARLVLEMKAPSPEAVAFTARRDQPVSFAERTYELRHVEIRYIDVSLADSAESSE